MRRLLDKCYPPMSDFQRAWILFWLYMAPVLLVIDFLRGSF